MPVDSVMTFTIDSVNLIKTDTCTILTYNLCITNLTENDICLRKTDIYSLYQFQINDTIIETNYYAYCREKLRLPKDYQARFGRSESFYYLDTIKAKSKCFYNLTFNDYYYSDELNKLNIQDSFRLGYFFIGGLLIGKCYYLVNNFGNLIHIGDETGYPLFIYINEKGTVYQPIQSNTFYWKRKKE